KLKQTCPELRDLLCCTSSSDLRSDLDLHLTTAVRGGGSVSDRREQQEKFALAAFCFTFFTFFIGPSWSKGTLRVLELKQRRRFEQQQMKRRRTLPNHLDEDSHSHMSQWTHGRRRRRETQGIAEEETSLETDPEEPLKDDQDEPITTRVPGLNPGKDRCESVSSSSWRRLVISGEREIVWGITGSKEMDKSLLPSVTMIVGCGVSSLTLLLLIIIYVSVWKYIRSERSVILINFCLSIICSNALILTGQTQARNKVMCSVVSALLHFFFLSSFCWVLTEAWQSYMTVTGRLRNRIIRKRFLCLGWGLPALVVAVSVGFTKAKGYGTVNYCWLSLEGGLLYSFVGPAAAVVLVNMVIGILVFNKLVSKDGITDVKLKERAGASLWSSCVVLPLLALTWMSAVLAITDGRSALFQILFAVFDSLEGFIIVMVHCILRREVQEAVKCRVVDRKDDGNGDSGSSLQNGHPQLMSDFEKDGDTKRPGGLQSSSMEKLPPPQLPLPLGPNFHTLPLNPGAKKSSPAPDYSSHTLTLRREAPRPSASTPSATPVYVCDSQLFTLNAQLAQSVSAALAPNTTSTLRAKPPRDESSNLELPSARVMLASATYAEPQAAYACPRASVSFSERDSPEPSAHNLSSESHVTSLGDTFDSMNSMMSKSETFSTLSISSLEVSGEGRQKSRYAELDFESVRWSVSSAGSDKTSHSDKQSGMADRSWESLARSPASPPAWIRSDLETLPVSEEWEKPGSGVALLSQDAIDLQTEV
ncbi:hypothetical protein DNTS_008409, partial [Danionella cerebrum]